MPGPAHLAERIRLAKAACARAESAGARMAHDEAEACYRRAVELAPNVPGFRIGWARALINAGRPRDAWPILVALRDSAHTPDLEERIRRVMGACANRIALQLEYAPSVEGTDWRQAVDSPPSAPTIFARITQPSTSPPPAHQSFATKQLRQPLQSSLLQSHAAAKSP